MRVSLKDVKVFAVDIDGTLTENGCGMVYLDGIATLRYLEYLGLRVIYVTGRASIEAYVLAVFGGTTQVAVGENGGAITTAPNEHILLANKQNCLKGYEILKKNIENVQMKPVFNRLTEVVLSRTFDIREGSKILEENNLNLRLSDSKYAYHINEKGVDKGVGLLEALRILNFDAKDTVAIGDSETDLPLFDLCGCSIALNHAEDSVKARATHVVRGGDGKGLVDAIDLVAFNYLETAMQNDFSRAIK
ncbi:MAG: phosphoglycolate phosphatase [Candidatus Nitrosopolaris sp.]